MRTTEEQLRTQLDIIDPLTGEVHNWSGTIERKHKNYSIKQINGRIYEMGLAEIQIKICSGKKSIELFWDLLRLTNKNNEIRINISAYIKKTGYTRSYVSAIIKKMKAAELIAQNGMGTYLVNPFIYISPSIRGAEIIERFQKEYKDLTGYQTDKEKR